MSLLGAAPGQVRVAVHQPDFLPWLGLFVKLAKCDTFVVLDHTENNPRAAFLCKRVKFQLPGSVGFLAVPVEHPADGRLGLPLHEMKINVRDGRAFEKARRSVEQAYKRAPFFADVFPLVDAYFGSETTSLVDRNMEFITRVCTALGITPTQIRSRSVDCEGQKGELVSSLVAAVGGTVYVSGDGGRAYQDPESFRRRNVRLAYNHFVPEPYARFQGVWEPGLSVIDALMNIGFAGTSTWVADAARSSEERARAAGEGVLGA